MASLMASWPSALGNEPPPLQTPDAYKLYVKYKGGWKTALIQEEAGTSYNFGEQPGGEYYVRVYGMYDGEISAGYGEDSIVIEGDQEDAVYGDPPPSGNADIADPGSLDLSSM